MKRNYLLLFILFLTSTCQQPTKSDSSRQEKVDWGKQVFYQIFPERFHNGDTSNDPKPEDITGGWPFLYFNKNQTNNYIKNWQPHPWTSDWYELQPWETNVAWHEIFDWAKPTDPTAKWYAQMRRYGGDIQGIIDKLDYLNDLGVTALYLNPVFESPSLHKYDAKLYRHIDKNFGPDPEGDKAIWEAEDPADPKTWKWTSADKLFLKLIKECHIRNMRIIIDGVFNHTGTNFWAFEDIVKKQQNSKYKNWYHIKTFDDPNTPENEFDYDGWIGVKELPEIKEDENGIVSGPKEHIHEIVKRWMDPNGDGDPSDGIDGWRLDVAEMVDMEFWKTFRAWCRGINPNCYLTGEVWWHDYPKNEMYNARPWLDEAFDGVMNYRTGRAIKHWVIDEKTKVPTQGFVDSLKNIYNDYTWEQVLTCQNLMDSHDVDRVASQIVNPDRWMDHEADIYAKSDYNIHAPDSLGWEKLKLIIAIQMSLPGAPMIYYGTEAGMWGGDDPDCRKPMVWEGKKYQEERIHPRGEKKQVDKVFFRKDLYEYYKKWIAARKKYPSLAVGDIEFIQINKNNTLVFKRKYKGRKVYVLINNNPDPVEFDISFLPKDNSYLDGITREHPRHFKISIPGMRVKILAPMHY